MKFLTFPFLLLLIFLPAHARANGCTLIVAYPAGQTLKETGDCAQQQSPASSFKLPLALMGYDAGILSDEHKPAWPFVEGYLVNKPDDKQTTDPTSWEKNSVVWYSQKITTDMGMEKFQHYVDQFQYGNRNLSGNEGQNDGLTQAWLKSSLTISPREQVAFVKAMLDRKLGVSDKAYDMTKAIIPAFEGKGGWAVKGKTGSVPAPGKTGWFVGWAEKGGKTIIFAKLLQPHDTSEGPGGPMARDLFLEELSGLTF